MDALYVQLVRGRDYPDLILMDNVMYRYYLQSLQAIQRVSSDSPDFVGLGYQTLEFGGLIESGYDLALRSHIN